MLCLTAACASSVEPEGEVITLEIAPHTAECRGEALRRCLQVRRAPGEAWTNFYDAIEGFEHEPGVTYRIEVLRRRVPDPPADGSAFTWRLLRVLSREPASGG